MAFAVAAPPVTRTLMLTGADVGSVLTMDLAVPAVESAFRALGNGEAAMPPKVYLPAGEGGDFRAMPGSLSGSAGLKWVNSHPENPGRHGLPAVMALFILSDPDTALPLAIMDATRLTAFRTGAAGAVASRYLAAPPRTIGFIGCGVQARTLHAAHRIVFRDFEAVLADRDPRVAGRLAAEIGGRVGTLREAAGCDIVCTATPSRAPLFPAAFVRPGAHVNAMGADAPGKQELDPGLLASARVVVDDREQALHSGELNVPVSRGEFSADRIHASLGEIVAGRIPGRAGADLTLFDSTGLAVQDVALARAVYDEARRRGLGTEIPLVA